MGYTGVHGGGAARLPFGFQARQLAVILVAAVLRDGRALDDAIGKAHGLPQFKELEPRDRALARMIATTVLRRQGQLEAVVSTFIDKPLPDKRGNLTPILLTAAAQLLFLESAPHAVINIAVEQCRHDGGARRFGKLANAVLRRTSERGREIIAAQIDGARLNIPDWLWQRWVSAYGEATALQIAAASLEQAPLDISVKDDPTGWAERLGATVLPTGSLRMAAEGRIEDLPGYLEGGWWVQDAAAALPAKLLGNVTGKRVADLCAAPGGKTASLAARGAIVTAVDQSSERLSRLSANLARLHLAADVIAADATTWAPAEPLDAVLLDAPCSATGTIRRHPDILRLKRSTDMAKLVPLQERLLSHAVTLVKVGGTIVFCTCSLEPEEGVEQVERLLALNANVRREPIKAEEIGGDASWITQAGDLRTLPFHAAGAVSGLSGLDGFYAARLVRIA